MFCYCIPTNGSSLSTDVRRVELRQNDTTIKSTTTCIVSDPIIYTLDSTGEPNRGRYQCVGILHNGTLTRVQAGDLHIIGEIYSKYKLSADISYCCYV